jgi:hypothetical protein
VFYTPGDFASGTRTFNPAGANLPPTAAPSLVVPNVLSFQVQGIVQGGAAPADGNYESSSPGNFVLQGLSITIRVWDNKTRQARQLTVVQDL